MRSSDTGMQRDSTLVFANISTGTVKHVAVFVNNARAIVEAVVYLLDSHDEEDIQTNAVRALTNIIRSNRSFYRDLVMRMNTMPPLIKLCTKGTSVQLLRKISCLVLNMFLQTPWLDLSFVEAVMPALAFLLTVDDEEVLRFTCGSLQCLSTYHNVDGRVAGSVCTSVLPEQEQESYRGNSRVSLDLDAIFWRRTRVYTLGCGMAGERKKKRESYRCQTRVHVCVFYSSI
jgi:hypothetical protein